jgi:transcriptional regulator with XRE-family HTH domain
MNTNFSRVITLLRKEKKISQKKASVDLEISQALLSHYEKGIRECGLDFVLRVAKYYGVSCDYLLGLSLDKQGNTISTLEIPEPDAGKDNVFKGSILPTLNKKLVSNSLNIIFDMLQKINSKALTNEVSSYFMLCVYNMFRILFSLNQKNNEDFFTIPKAISTSKSNSEMFENQANIKAFKLGLIEGEEEALKNIDNIQIDSETLSKEYPLFSSSLLSLIQHTESKLKK